MPRFHVHRSTDIGATPDKVFQIVADFGNNDLARVQTDTNSEIEPTLHPQLVGVTSQFTAQLKRGITGPLGVIFVSDRRPKQCHNAIAGVLIDCPFKAMNPGGEDLEKIIQNGMPGFRFDLFGQFH